MLTVVTTEILESDITLLKCLIDGKDECMKDADSCNYRDIRE